MFSDFYAYYINENKVIHIWDEKKVPVITGYDGPYASYSGERWAVKADLVKPEALDRNDLYENGVPAELIEESTLMFLESRCIDSSLKILLNGACHRFFPDTTDFQVGGIYISNTSKRGLLDVTQMATIDGSVPVVEER